jgi:tight adherence protein B
MASVRAFRQSLDLGARFRDDVELSGVPIDLERLGLAMMGIAAIPWLAFTIVVRPPALLIALALMASVSATAYFTHLYLRSRRNARVSAFRGQLEGALRTLAGGVRVGLGVRQALVLTAEQAREPAKSEFMRIVGLSNVGVNTLDAFDQLAARMELTETDVLARVLRVQSQTGGDLATVLEGLAGTIRDRRRLLRRVSAITAQGRATAWLLGFMPMGVGAFILATQPQLREAMLVTNLGRVFLASALGLDVLAVACLMKITRIDP